MGEPRHRPARDHRVAIAGLMRCCIQTVEECTEEVAEGHILRCRWCPSIMVLHEGVWRWSKLDYESQQTNPRS